MTKAGILLFPRNIQMDKYGTRYNGSPSEWGAHRQEVSLCDKEIAKHTAERSTPAKLCPRLHLQRLRKIFFPSEGITMEPTYDQ